MEKIHQGIGTQLMNCPLDLFVEEYIYKNYPMLRPVQLLSMFSMEQDAEEPVGYSLTPYCS